jgi:hypothetical protein
MQSSILTTEILKNYSIAELEQYVKQATETLMLQKTKEIQEKEVKEKEIIEKANLHKFITRNMIEELYRLTHCSNLDHVEFDKLLQTELKLFLTKAIKYYESTYHHEQIYLYYSVQFTKEMIPKLNQFILDAREHLKLNINNSQQLFLDEATLIKLEAYSTLLTNSFTPNENKILHAKTLYPFLLKSYEVDNKDITKLDKDTYDTLFKYVYDSKHVIDTNSLNSLFKENILLSNTTVEWLRQFILDSRKLNTIKETVLLNLETFATQLENVLVTPTELLTLKLCSQLSNFVGWSLDSDSEVSVDLKVDLKKDIREFLSEIKTYYKTDNLYNHGTSFSDKNEFTQNWLNMFIPIAKEHLKLNKKNTKVLMPVLEQSTISLLEVYLLNYNNYLDLIKKKEFLTKSDFNELNNLVNFAYITVFDDVATLDVNAKLSVEKFVKILNFDKIIDKTIDKTTISTRLNKIIVKAREHLRLNLNDKNAIVLEESVLNTLENYSKELEKSVMLDTIVESPYNKVKMSNREIQEYNKIRHDDRNNILNLGFDNDVEVIKYIHNLSRVYKRDLSKFSKVDYFNNILYDPSWVIIPLIDELTLALDVKLLEEFMKHFDISLNYSFEHNNVYNNHLNNICNTDLKDSTIEMIKLVIQDKRVTDRLLDIKIKNEITMQEVLKTINNYITKEQSVLNRATIIKSLDNPRNYNKYKSIANLREHIDEATLLLNNPVLFKIAK